MKVSAVSVLSLFLWASSAAAQVPPAAPALAPAAPAEPSTGTAWLAVGGTSLGLGILNAASAAACPSVRSRGLCYAGSFGFGAGLSVFGIVGLVLGVRQRTAWTMWKATVTPSPTGSTFSLRGTF